MTPALPPLTASHLSAVRRQAALVLHTDVGPVPLAAVLAWGDAAVADRNSFRLAVLTLAEFVRVPQEPT